MASEKKATTEKAPPKEQPKLTKEMFSEKVRKAADELRETGKLMTNLIELLGRNINADVSFTAIDDSKKLIEKLKTMDLKTNAKNIHSLLVSRAKERMKEV